MAVRSYSVAEAERIAYNLPLDRRYTYMEAAFSAAQYLYPDPVFWLEQAALAGMDVQLNGELIESFGVGPLTDQMKFLDLWLALGNGRRPLKRLLEKRRQQTDGVAE